MSRSSSPLIRILRRRTVLAIPVIVCVVVLNFLLLRTVPGDLVDVMAAQQQISDPAILERMRQEYGLTRSGPEQLLDYARGVVGLHLGYSNYYHQPVASLVVGRLPATMLLMAASLVLAAAIGVLAGVVASLRPHGWLDNLALVLSVTTFGAPNFWVGLMLMVLLAVKFPIFPVAGLETLDARVGGMARIVDVARHLVLPALSLGLFYAGIYARVTRAAMLEVKGADFIRTARAKGLSEHRIAWKHALRNALLPVVTLVGLQIGAMIGGAVVVETVFNWPGVGTLLLEAVQARDLPVVLGVLLVTSVVVIVSNIVVDIVYLWIDPRLSRGQDA